MAYRKSNSKTGRGRTRGSYAGRRSAPARRSAGRYSNARSSTRGTQRVEIVLRADPGVGTKGAYVPGVPGTVGVAAVPNAPKKATF